MMGKTLENFTNVNGTTFSKVKLESDYSNIKTNLFFNVFTFFKKNVHQQSIIALKSIIQYFCMATNGKLHKICCMNK